MGNSHSSSKSCYSGGDKCSKAPGESRRTRNSNFLNPVSTHRNTRADPAAAAPPPPYSAVEDALPVPPPKPSTTASTSSRSSPRDSALGSLFGSNLQAEDALETLRKFDTVILVDDSTSMTGSLWEEAKHALTSLAHTASMYDANGIDIHFLNSKRVGINMNVHVSSAGVNQLFEAVRPRGATPIGEKLEELLLGYMSLLDKAASAGDRKSVKAVNFIVITDGCPTDDPETVIVSAAKRLDAGNYPLSQVGIQFVQIGNSAYATAYLKGLDDTLGPRNGIRDMVDTTPYSGSSLTSESLIKILLGGINRRVDRHGAESIL